MLTNRLPPATLPGAVARGALLKPSAAGAQVSAGGFVNRAADAAEHLAKAMRKSRGEVFKGANALWTAWKIAASRRQRALALIPSLLLTGS